MEFTNDTYLAAVFFISRQTPEYEESIEVLLQKSQATNIEPSKYVKGWWDCKWAEMNCEAYLHNKLPDYQLLVIQFLQGVFLERGRYSQQEKNLPLEKDGNLKLALAFRDACETLQPEVAYIATHLDRAEFDIIMKVVHKIEVYDANYIAGEGGLIYLRGIIADCLTDPPPEYAPDTMPVKEGVLVFGGQGSKRWW